MKEASGELSMTAVAVVAIAAIGVIFGTLIFPNIKASLSRQQLCSSAYGCKCTNGTCACKAIDSSNKEVSVTCDDPNSN